MFRNAVDKFGHALLSEEEEEETSATRARERELQTISRNLKRPLVGNRHTLQSLTI